MPKLFIILASLLVALPVAAEAQNASFWAEAPEVRVRLISGVEATGQDGTIPLGLEIALAPHWKTYWRNPGTAGLPVSVDWTGSENFAQATMRWPAPLRFEYAGIESFGYTDRVILPISLGPAQIGAAVSLKARVDMMACEKLCIPFTFNLALDLPAGAATSSEYAGELASWEQRVPKATHPQLGITDVQRTENGYSLRVTADPPLTQPDVIVEARSGYVYGKPAFTPGTPAILTVTRAGEADPSIQDDTEITLTLIDGDRALEKTVSVPATSNPATATATAAPERMSLLSALMAAFIGGLILNLMPCVLPVLSLKLLSIVSHGGAPARHVRLSFLASAAGIITSFLALAGIAIGLKQAGMAVGWGLQFQHPAFIITMVGLLTLFSASLYGLLHIPLPRFMADAINDTLPAPGQHDNTLLGNFVTGAFATILATPCSAPFVGTALGFALAGGSVDILLTALFMGIGLATPYLLVATFPALAHKLPRPGRWMNWLKIVLGTALLITALWLASTARQQLEQEMAMYVVGAPLFVLTLLVVKESFSRPIILLKAVGLLAALLAASSAYEHFTAQDEQVHVRWQQFDQPRIATLVSEGKTVFVDVTADWCLTCHANKKLVLDTEPTTAVLSGANVVAMKADWTRPNDEIAAYLRSFGRYGIPFNVVYGPGAPQGIALPELLSAEVVKEALEKAGTPSP